VRALDEALARGRVETACAFMGSLDRDDGDVAAETPLVRALGHLHPRVRVAAAQALGRIGTVAAVLPLKQAAERFGDLQGASRQAVAQIQSRAVGATPGQISLSGGGGQGQVSLAEGAGGHVSLPEGRGD
jgi:HEAT repeat protein